MYFADVLQSKSSLKYPNIYRKTTVLDSLFNNVPGLQTSNFIKKWLQHRCFPVNFANFLRTAFSIEHLWWRVLCLLEREEEESVEQRSKEKCFKLKKKMKTCKCKYNYVNIIELLTLFFFYFFFKFSFLQFLYVHFLCFHSWQTGKYILLHLSGYSEAGIESLSVKQLLGKI